MIDRAFTRLLVTERIERLQTEAERSRLSRSASPDPGDRRTVSVEPVRGSGPVWRWRPTRG